MLKPRALRPDDRLAVVAPASPFAVEDFQRGVAELRRLGFQPVYDESVFDRRGYLAGEPEKRAQAVLSAWRDPSIAGTIAARGGYGSVQILPWLDVLEAQRARKAFVGYSDLTSILTFLSTGCGLVCFHGPTVAGQLGPGEAAYHRESFLGSLTSTRPLGELPVEDLEALSGGEAAGLLLGGTLTQIVASLGTPFAFAPPAGFVLFLDEVGERPYRLDRMMMQLRLSGVLARASAIVFGQLPHCDEPGGGVTAKNAIAEALRGFPGPVLFGFPSGHTRGPALTLPFGVRARVVADRAPRLIIEEAAVE